MLQFQAIIMGLLCALNNVFHPALPYNTTAMQGILFEMENSSCDNEAIAFLMMVISHLLKLRNTIRYFTFIQHFFYARSYK